MKTIAVDFDGVLHGYSLGWQDGTIYDEPKPLARESMALLCEKFEVVIFSTRCFPRTVRGKFEPSQDIEVAAWLKKHNIPYTRIHTEPCKPLCVAFIDDNAIRHINWASTMNVLMREGLL